MTLRLYRTLCCRTRFWQGKLHQSKIHFYRRGSWLCMIGRPFRTHPQFQASTLLSCSLGGTVSLLGIGRRILILSAKIHDLSHWPNPLTFLRGRAVCALHIWSTCWHHLLHWRTSCLKATTLAARSQMDTSVGQLLEHRRRPPCIRLWYWRFQRSTRLV